MPGESLIGFSLWPTVDVDRVLGEVEEDLALLQAKVGPFCRLRLGRAGRWRPRCSSIQRDRKR